MVDILLSITYVLPRCLELKKILPFHRFLSPFLLVFALIFSGFVFGQRKPSLGLTVGASALSGSSGFMFDSNLEPPHRDFGAQAGLTAFIPMDLDLHLTVGLMGSFELSHFHADVGDMREVVTGYFHYGFVQIPILLNHAPMHKSKSFFVLKEFFGFGLNVGNVFDTPHEQTFGNTGFASSTVVSQNWQINPEFIIGVGLISRQLKIGKLHYSLSLHIDVARNQHFQARLINTETGQSIFAERTMRGVKGQLSMTYYPSFQRKRKACYRIGR